MGYFTWRDCQDRRKKVPYDHPAYVICPDDTVIKESSYNGYGMFGGHDIYELVVDWNRPYLKEIYDRLETEFNRKVFLKKIDGGFFFGSELREVAIAAMESDEKAIQIMKKKESSFPEYLHNEWKRNIGIAIACEDEDNESLPFPIKISATPPKKTYAELKPSWSDQ